MSYKTFTRSATNFSEFSSAKKHTVDTGLTYDEARRACQEYNKNRTEEEKEAGTKMEFTEESAPSPARERIDEMMSGGQIMKLANDAAVRAAKRKQEPRVFFDAADIEEYFGNIPNIDTFRPEGWELVEQRMVDKSGWGAYDEPALTVEGYKKWLSEYLETPETVGWAIIEEGQFQIVVGRFVKAGEAPAKAQKKPRAYRSPAQRTNARQDRIWDKSKALKAERDKAQPELPMESSLAVGEVLGEAFQRQHPSIDLKKAHLYQEEPPRCPRCGSEAGAHSEDCELGIHPDDDPRPPEDHGGFLPHDSEMRQDDAQMRPWGQRGESARNRIDRVFEGEIGSHLSGEPPLPESEQIYRTKSGVRVRVTKARQFPVDPSNSKDLQAIHKKSNEGTRVIRIKDGHELWGVKPEDLMPESKDSGSPSAHQQAQSDKFRAAHNARTRAPEEPLTAADERYFKWHKQRYRKVSGEEAERALRPFGEARELSVPQRHQLKIARDTLKMSDAGARIMGGPTKEEAREIILRLTGKKMAESEGEGTIAHKFAKDNGQLKDAGLPELSPEEAKNLEGLPEPMIAAFKKVKARWNKVGLPYYDSLNGCVMVEVGSGEGGNGMWLGIEKDGYTHS